MYNFEELNKMDEAALQEIARESALKNITTVDKENLV